MATIQETSSTRAIAYASLPGLSRVPLTLTLSRKRERGRDGAARFPLSRLGGRGLG
jgi:hypothetical protein